eukprot:gene7046-11209_t
MTSSKMNDFVLTQILAENEKLERELESSKQAVKASEAIKTLQEYIEQPNSEPFDPSYKGDEPNPFLSAPPGPGCCVVM